MNNDVKWIKIVTDIFDDEKILLIEELPDGDSVIVVWFKLLCLAGKQNNNGVFIFNDIIPYTDKMLATIFRRKESVVRFALDTFERFGMIEIVNGVITIPNWGKHQDLEKITKRNEYMRVYMRDYRKKQAAITCKVNGKPNSKSNVNAPEGEGEGDKEPISFSKENDYQTGIAVRQAIEAWNSLCEYGIQPIKKMSSSSDRYKMLNARIKQYGIDEVIRTILSVKDSDFLLGKAIGSRKPFILTFDWFVKPNNFPKVNEGNYLNRGIQPVNNRAHEETDSAYNDLE